MKKWFITLASIVGSICISLLVWNDMPQQMAIHFNTQSQPDVWMDKGFGLFILPAVTILVAVILLVSLKLEKNNRNKQRFEANIGSIMNIVSLVILLVHLFTIGYNLGYFFGAAVFATALTGIMFILLGNVLPRLPQGFSQWPKLNDVQHRKLTSYQGKLMVLMGFIYIMLLLLPVPAILPLYFLLLACFIILTFVGWIRLTKNKRT